MVINNPKTRGYLYVGVIIAIAASFVYGAVNPTQLSNGIQAATDVAGLLTLILARLNLTPTNTDEGSGV